MIEANAKLYLEGKRECPYCDTKQAADHNSTEYEDSETKVIRRTCRACKNTWLDLYDFAAVATDSQNESEKDSETFNIPQSLCRCKKDENKAGREQEELKYALREEKK